MDKENIQAVYLVKPTNTSLEKRVDEFIEYLKSMPYIMSHIYPYTWISGETTEVYPIMVWKGSVDIQWDSNRKCPKTIETIVNRFSDILERGYFSKSDGSCPSYISFRLKETLW